MHSYINKTDHILYNLKESEPTNAVYQQSSDHKRKIASANQAHDLIYEFNIKKKMIRKKMVFQRQSPEQIG